MAEDPWITIDSPSSRLLPDVLVIGAENVRSERGVLRASGVTTERPLPADAVLRELREADLLTPEGVAEALAVLGLDMGASLDLLDLGLIDTVLPDPAPLEPHAPALIEGFFRQPNVLDAVASCGRSSPIAEGWIVPGDDTYTFGCKIDCGPWQPVSRRLRVVRAAVNHYVAHQSGADPLTAWTDEGFEPKIERSLLEPIAPGVRAEIEEPDFEATAEPWRLFVAAHARLLRDHVPQLAVWLAKETGSLRIAALSHDLSAALMVQLHNLIVDGLEVRRCANETCGRPFTRQRGRAATGQFRTRGVVYCDSTCANAQMQRVYRRRRRRREDL